MTENEAKEILENIWNFTISANGNNEYLLRISIDTAIQSLAEIQQYRAIGTVKELINTQIREKVLNVELESYKEIGTIEDFKDLKEKNEPAKVIEHEAPHFVHWQCGNCGAEFYSGQKFCDECGHPADWGDLLK